MAQYNVRVGDSSYRVGKQLPQQYQLDVNYQIPSKSTQYSNLLIDSIASQFDGVQDTFNITVDGESYTPLNEEQIAISINNVILEPKVDYVVSNDQIVFNTPPAGGAAFFGIAYATTADLTRTLNYVIDSGSFPMSNGVKGNMTIDVTGEIESWTIISDTEGNVEVDVQKCSFEDFPNFSSICGTERPTLGVLNNSVQRKNKDDNLSTWNTTVNAGDIFQFEVIYSVNISRFVVSLKLKL
ncbi:virion structural protein [Synechococcus phage S-CAM3]|uniref:Uncharacterized protein n=1 Tax=Synechococcus phage S-CAM3 TaxID=1883366 RepID=A0A1D8KK90_9CAUD|nr:virion structural protein [Synechococcus phage S-CAM3]AOV58597.1 hypothetical protein S250808_092 [Synechococcus phage S-CAM3]AOV59075.1 hypothetical protein C421010_092 [Synechococcus phage S-CAM3]